MVRSIVLLGPQGCGKSEVGKKLSENLGLPFVEGDDFHPPANIAKMNGGTPLTDDDREPWLNRIASIIALHNAVDGCVVACSALKHPYREILRKRNANLIFIYLKGSHETLRKRLTAGAAGDRKDHFMPPDLLDSQLAVLEEPAADEAFTVSIEQSPDGVVAEIIALLNNKS